MAPGWDLCMTNRASALCVGCPLGGHLKGHRNLGLWGAEPDPLMKAASSLPLPPGAIPDALDVPLPGGKGLTELWGLSALTALTKQRQKGTEMHRRKKPASGKPGRICAAEGRKAR